MYADPAHLTTPERSASRPAAHVHARLLLASAVFRFVPAFVAGRLRTAALRACGVRIGARSTFWGMPRLVGSGDIAARLHVGEDCGFNDGCYFGLEGEIEIGNHVAVGHEVVFETSGFTPGGPGQRAGDPVCGRIVIGDGAWLGARCAILPGVTVGAGSVIGAGVVVAQDVPPNTLVTGLQKISLAKWR